MTTILAALLDRDGVLNVDKGYTHRLEDLVFVSGAAAAVRRLNQAGRRVIVVTNQAGVARGLYDEAAVERFHAEMNAALAAEGARIDAFYACPFHPDAAIAAYRHADHPDRKPNPGMVLRALRDFNVAPGHAFLIGDRETDLQAASRAGVRGYLFDETNLDHFAARVLNAEDRLMSGRPGSPLDGLQS